jgi:hypothetical protein
LPAGRLNRIPRTLQQAKLCALKKEIGAYTGKDEISFDNFRVLPYMQFVDELWKGELL